jgi:hypothetical protein
MAFLHSPASDIQQLKVLLKEQYTDLAAILIEAVQNADDARATTAILRVVDGIDGAEHPLLGDKALLILNDGPFNASDRRGICSLNFGTKGGTTEQIGRFGLGLKSIFHLGDCFFFSAAMSSPGMRHGDREITAPTLLNPWYDDRDEIGFYPEWTKRYNPYFDGRRLQERMQNEAISLGLGEHWFAIWVPLRRAVRIVKGNRLSDRDWGDQITEASTALGGDKAQTLLLATMPLLRHVAHVQFVGADSRPDGNGSWCVSVASGSARRRELAWHGNDTLDGSVTVRIGTTETGLAITGREHRLPPHERGVKDLVSDERWPRVPSQQDGALVTRADRHDPHGAVLCMTTHHPNAGPCLRISWAANTPLADMGETIFPTRPPGIPGLGLHLVIHGEYFVDSGRRHIDHSETTILGRWNTLITSRVAAPLFIPTLHRWLAENAGKRPADLAWVVDAVGKSQTWQRNRYAYSAFHNLALCMTESGPAWLHWEPDDQPLVQVPESMDLGMLLRDCPGIRQVLLNARVALGGISTLTKQNPATWSRQLVTLLLEPGEQIGREPASLQMLTVLFRQLQDHGALGGDVRPRLVTLLDKVLGNQPEGNLTEERRLALASLIGTLPRESRWILDTAALGLRAGRVLARLLSNTVPGLLVLSADIGGQNAENPELSVGHALALIRRMRMADVAEIDVGGEVLSALVRALVRQGGPSPREELLDAIADVPWIHARDGRQATGWHSWAEVSSRAQSGLLVAWQGTSNELYQTFCQALSNEQPLAVDRIDDQAVVARMLGTDIPRCDPASIAAIVAAVRLHADPTRRSALVPRLLSCGNREAVRHLLHGNWEHRSDASVKLLVLTQRGSTQVINRLLKDMLAESGEGWSVLDACMAVHLTPNAKIELGVTDAEDEAITGFQYRNPDVLYRLVDACTNDERMELQEGIRDRATALALPIWRTTDDRWIQVCTGKAYRDPQHHMAVLGVVAGHSGLNILREAEGPRGREHVLLTPTLTPSILVRHLLAGADPHRWFQPICAFLDQMGLDMRHQLEPVLDDSPWIPLADGTTASIRHVVPVESLTPWVQRARERHAPVWTDALMDPSLRKELIPLRLWSSSPQTKRSALESLVGHLRTDANMGFGPWLSAKVNLEDINRVADILGGDAPDGWRFISDVLKDKALAGDVDHLLNTVLTRLPSRLSPAIYARVIEGFRRCHTHADIATRVSMRTVLAWYLGALDEPERIAVMTGSYLPNRRDVWCPTSAICAGLQGVDPIQQVHEDLESIWTTRVANPDVVKTFVPKSDNDGKTVYEKEIEESVSAIEEFFHTCRDIVPDSVIGAFFAVLGSHECFDSAARRYLGPSFRSPSQLRAELIVGRSNDTVLLQVTDGVTATMPALAIDGSVIQVRLMASKDKPEFLPDRQRRPTKLRYLHTRDGRMVIPVTFHKFDLSRLPKPTILTCLRDAIEGVICLLGRGTFNRESWEKICRPHQQDLLVLRKVMLPKAMVQLEQFRLPVGSKIRSVLRNWRFYQHQRAAGVVVSVEQEQIILDELDEALVDDATAESEALRAIRAHIGPSHYQYNNDSVPFELVQNADDAIGEEVWLRGKAGDATPVSHRITIRMETQSIAVIHGGRQINRTRRGGFDATERGFDRDLEKMLSISVSDKNSDGDIQVTGRFGLGFKSCYLICDRPEILSGDYCCRIYAGMIPQEIPGPDEDKPLRALAHDSADGGHGLTVTHLPFRDTVDPDDVSRRFLALAPWLSMTLRYAGEIACVQQGHQHRTFSVTTSYRNPSGSIAVFDLAGGQQRALVMGRRDAPERIMLVVGMDHQGPVPLPSHVPGLWLTTPLRQAEDHGFFVNAPFRVDVGRGQIAIDEASNATVVERLQAEVLTALEDLWRLCHDDDSWLIFIEQSGMSAALMDDRAGFWAKLVNILAKPFLGGRSGDALLRRVLWDNSESAGCIRRFLTSGKRIPSCLPNPASPFIAVQDDILVVDGDFVTLLPDFVRPQWIDRSVLRESTGSRCLSLLGLQPASCSLASLCGLRQAEAQLTPAIAESLASISGKLAADDPRRLMLLRDIRQAAIATAGGTWPRVDTVGIMLPAVDVDAALWALIADPLRVLAAKYSPSAQRLLREAGSRPPPDQVFAGWILEAEGERRKIALQCLEVASAQIRTIVMVQAAGTYLEVEANSTAPTASPLAAAMLKQGLGITATGSAKDSVQPAPSNALNNIISWWNSERKAQVAIWEAQHYPHGGAPSEWDVSQQGQRLAWMRLFALSFAQRIGRARPGQHKAFIGVLEKRGWLQRLAEEGRHEDPLRVVCRDLMQQFDDAVQDVEYTNWWSMILQLAIVGRRLDDYVDALRELGKGGDPGDINTWFSPRIQPQLQGVVDAPPIGALMGIGRHFMVRELLRRGLINHPGLHSYCYVPSSRVLELLSWISGRPKPAFDGDHTAASRWIFAIVGGNKKQSPLGTDFDIPFDLLATDRDLQARVIGKPMPNKDD